MVDKNMISTLSGIRFNPLSPKPCDICIDDIAHALSLICRGNGQISCFYSVARHSICCAKEAYERGLGARVELLCLIHDAAEAYIGDMTRPLKRQMPKFADCENELVKVIFEALEISPMNNDELKAVKEIDNAMLYHEFKMMNGYELYDEVPIIHIEISTDFVDFKETETEFKKLFLNLKGEMKNGI